jgi:hypothetical protein
MSCLGQPEEGGIMFLNNECPRLPDYTLKTQQNLKSISVWKTATGPRVHTRSCFGPRQLA